MIVFGYVLVGLLSALSAVSALYYLLFLRRFKNTTPPVSRSLQWQVKAGKVLPFLLAAGALFCLVLPAYAGFSLLGLWSILLVQVWPYRGWSGRTFLVVLMTTTALRAAGLDFIDIDWPAITMLIIIWVISSVLGILGMIAAMLKDLRW